MAPRHADKALVKSGEWMIAVLQWAEESGPILDRLREALRGQDAPLIREALVDGLAILEKHSGYRPAIDAFVTITEQVNDHFTGAWRETRRVCFSEDPVALPQAPLSTPPHTTPDR